MYKLIFLVRKQTLRSWFRELFWKLRRTKTSHENSIVINPKLTELFLWFAYTIATIPNFRFMNKCTIFITKLSPIKNFPYVIMLLTQRKYEATSMREDIALCSPKYLLPLTSDTGKQDLLIGGFFSFPKWKVLWMKLKLPYCRIWLNSHVKKKDLYWNTQLKHIWKSS